MGPTKMYIGIDIGKNGAIAVIKPTGEILTYPMPMIKTELDYHALSNMINILQPHSPHVIFEKLGVIYGTSKSTAFSMGEQSGCVEMASICQGLSYTKVRAIDWQKAMFQGVDEILKTTVKEGKKPGRDTKAMALVAIKRLFPGLKLTFGEKAKKPHDGLIDAVLMAEYARRNNL